MIKSRVPVQSGWRSMCLSRTRMYTTSPESTITATSEPTAPSPDSDPENPPATHFKITLRRSAISLGDKKKGTLVALGLHRRFQTVYQRHTPEAAGKILLVKELVEVENVPESLVKTQEEQRRQRKALRGYKVVGCKKTSCLDA